MNSEKDLYEYAIIRVVPDLEREEFVNVGLLMMCKRRRWLRCHVNLPACRLRALAPQADIDLIKAQLEMFSRCCQNSKDWSVEERFRWLTAVKSSMLQTSRPHPGLAEAGTLDATFERLLRRLVAPD